MEATDGGSQANRAAELAEWLREGGLPALSALIAECEAGLGLDRRPERDELNRWVTENYTK